MNRRRFLLTPLALLPGLFVAPDMVAPPATHRPLYVEWDFSNAHVPGALWRCDVEKTASGARLVFRSVMAGRWRFVRGA